jgi:hypothetical protein
MYHFRGLGQDLISARPGGERPRFGSGPAEARLLRSLHGTRFQDLRRSSDL